MEAKVFAILSLSLAINAARLDNVKAANFRLLNNRQAAPANMAATSYSTMAPTPSPTPSPTTATPAPTTTYSSGQHTNMPPMPPKKPNILLFLADDMGHADLSYNEGNIWTPTPNIDKIAWDGIILHRHYSNPVCTPTRAALMTSKYVFHIGMQTGAIGQGEPWGVPLQFKMQPVHWKALGYQTYHVGKWHLGEHTREYYPVGRGFDYSFGFTSGDCNWFNYTEGWVTPYPLAGRVFRENGKVIFPNHTHNHYMPHLLVEKGEQIIRNSDPNVPWFMYFATPLVHASFEDFYAPQFVMPQYQLRPSVFKFSASFPDRRKQLAVVQCLDESFKRMIDALVNKGVVDNTIVAFLADNGAPLPESQVFVHGTNYGSNWPLRLGKGALFEGGVRTPGFIWSPLLRKRGRITHQLFHVTDWLPTLYEAAGGNLADLDTDGHSHWQSFQAGLSYGPRKEIPNNIDTNSNQYAMIYEDQYGTLYKVIGGNVFNNRFIGWDRPIGTIGDEWKTWSPLSINCNFPEGVEISECKPWVSACLFDLTNDPCEQNNIAASYPSMLHLIMDKIHAYNATSFPAGNRPFDAESEPARHEGVWVPWLDRNEVADREVLAYTPFSPSDRF